MREQGRASNKLGRRSGALIRNRFCGRASIEFGRTREGKGRSREGGRSDDGVITETGGRNETLSAIFFIFPFARARETVTLKSFPPASIESSFRGGSRFFRGKIIPIFEKEEKTNHLPGCSRFTTGPSLVPRNCGGKQRAARPGTMRRRVPFFLPYYSFRLQVEIKGRRRFRKHPRAPVHQLSQS